MYIGVYPCRLFPVKLYVLLYNCMVLVLGQGTHNTTVSLMWDERFSRWILTDTPLGTNQHNPPSNPVGPCLGGRAVLRRRRKRRACLTRSRLFVCLFVCEEGSPCCLLTAPSPEIDPTQHAVGQGRQAGIAGIAGRLRSSNGLHQDLVKVGTVTQR